MHAHSLLSFILISRANRVTISRLLPPVATADAANETQANSVKSFIRSVDLEGRRDWFASQIGGSMMTLRSHRGEPIT